MHDGFFWSEYRHTIKLNWIESAKVLASDGRASYAPVTMVVPVLISTALMLLGNAARASDVLATPSHAPEQSVAQPADNTPAQRLDEAVRLYQTGDPTQAQSRLANLVNDTSYDNETLRQRARVFLGEVLYLQQSEEDARRVFEAVLTLEPNYVIDPFQHPPDVCGFFETIRTYIRPPDLPAVAAPVPPTPLSAYLGFGIYQLKYNQKALGTSMAIGQTTFGLISAMMFVGLLDNRKYTSGVDDERRAVQTRKAIQWGATAGFYGFWGWSGIDANRHWRTNVEMHSVSASRQPAWSGGPNEFHVRLTFPTR